MSWPTLRRRLHAELPGRRAAPSTSPTTVTAHRVSHRAALCATDERALTRSVLLLFGLILPLTLDTFAVSVALGVVGVAQRRRLTLSLIFAGFEGGMPVIGLLFGAVLGQLLGDVAGLAAIVSLIGLGVYVLFANEEGQRSHVMRLARSGGLVLLTAGLLVSLDELAIGFVLGLLDVPILPAIAAITVQAFVISQLGFRFGGKVAERVRERAERLAGIALIGLGLLLLASRFVSFPS